MPSLVTLNGRQAVTLADMNFEAAFGRGPVPLVSMCRDPICDFGAGAHSNGLRSPNSASMVSRTTSCYEPWSQERAAAIVDRHLDERGPLMPILHQLQDVFGHIDPGPSTSWPMR